MEILHIPAVGKAEKITIPDRIVELDHWHKFRLKNMSLSLSMLKVEKHRPNPMSMFVAIAQAIHPPKPTAVEIIAGKSTEPAPQVDSVQSTDSPTQ